jgi:hypothetical protein
VAKVKRRPQPAQANNHLLQNHGVQAMLRLQPLNLHKVGRPHLKRYQKLQPKIRNRRKELLS